MPGVISCPAAKDPVRFRRKPVSRKTDLQQTARPRVMLDGQAAIPKSLRAAAPSKNFLTRRESA